MNTTFRRHELPMAFAMIDASERVKPRRDGRDPYDRYFLLWTAFNAIYTIIAARAGVRTQLVTNADGSVVTRVNGSVQIPVVRPAGEPEQIYLALEEFSAEQKHQLITHRATEFFKDRTPFWEGQKIEQDALGQTITGVIHVNDTTGPDYPVWSPIDAAAYDRYFETPDDAANRDFLAQQVMDLLFTVRQNLVHFSRKFDDSNDLAVIEHALLLLEIIIAGFTR